jgi:hypothetical protein
MHRRSADVACFAGLDDIMPELTVWENLDIAAREGLEPRSAG